MKEYICTSEEFILVSKYFKGLFGHRKVNGIQHIKCYSNIPKKLKEYANIELQLA